MGSRERVFQEHSSLALAQAYLHTGEGASYLTVKAPGTAPGFLPYLHVAVISLHKRQRASP